uniref:Uncharacterized protein n=1 Tax=Glossina morsitans morsitans TaxID=37546 RepID=A0ABK9NG94_GLOMM
MVAPKNLHVVAPYGIPDGRNSNGLLSARRNGCKGFPKLDPKILLVYFPLIIEITLFLINFFFLRYSNAITFIVNFNLLFAILSV